MVVGNIDQDVSRSFRVAKELQEYEEYVNEEAKDNEPFSKYGWDWWEANYVDASDGQGGTAVLKPMDVIPWIKGYWATKACIKMFEVNIGYKHWTQTAMMLWMTSVSDIMIGWMYLEGWFDTHFSRWMYEYSDVLNAIKRSCSMDGIAVQYRDTLSMRKIFMLTYREKDPPDWAAERERRMRNTPAHMYPSADGFLCRKKWLQKTWKYMNELAERIVGMMTSTLRLENVDDWWASRYAWAASGSSSRSNDVIESHKRNGDHVPEKSRANKKVVLSSMDNEHLDEVMASEPGKVPRKSSKPEPGKKVGRALYATDDDAYLMASYASVAQEKYINIDGIYAQQAPGDVAEWIKLHTIYKSRKAWFLSLDYSDYNTEHETTMLAMVDLAFMRAWANSGAKSDVKRYKTFMSAWCALSHLNAWVDFETGEGPEKVLGGLFSGDRDTSKHNCITHALYSKLMEEAAAELLDDFEMLEKMMTGDDEDGILSNWVECLVYMTVHARAGFVLKTSKQWAGNGTVNTHEYLQRALIDDHETHRPVAATIAQLCSGNWYDENYVWLDGIITSVGDNCWELHLRGVPLLVVQSCAAHVLNRTMNVRIPESEGTGWKPLEWFRYRTNGVYSPLWNATSEKAPVVPTGSDAVRPMLVMPGVDAWVNKASKRFGQVLSKEDASIYRHRCAVEASCPMFKFERNKEMHEKAYWSWDERNNMHGNPSWIAKQMLPLVDEQTVKGMLMTGYAERHPESIATLVSRFGIDMQMFDLIGGMKGLLKMLKPEDCAQLENIVEAKNKPWWIWRLDPSMRSWLCSAFQVPWMPLEKRALVWVDGRNNFRSARSISIVVAGNASGKTTAKNSKHYSYLCDSDEVFKKAGLIEYVKNTHANASANLPQWLVQKCSDALLNVSPEILMTQYPSLWMVEILEKSHLKIASVNIINVNGMDRTERAMQSRGWSFSKCERRISRFDSTVSHWVRYAQNNNIMLRDYTNILDAVEEVIECNDSQKDKKEFSVENRKYNKLI